MGKTSKDLLQLEHKNSLISSSESALLVCNKTNSRPESQQSEASTKLVTAPITKSEVLGRAKNFLSIISEANKRLELDAKENSHACDIEVLDGNESQVIEMDLMLGVADLNTPEAIAAAESAIAGNQPVDPLAGSSSETESDDSSDDTDSSQESGDDVNDNEETCSPLKLKISKTTKNDSSSKSTIKSCSKKRPRIIELS